MHILEKFLYIFLCKRNFPFANYQEPYLYCILITYILSGKKNLMSLKLDANIVRIAFICHRLFLSFTLVLQCVLSREVVAVTEFSRSRRHPNPHLICQSYALLPAVFPLLPRSRMRLDIAYLFLTKKILLLRVCYAPANGIA